MNKVYKTIVIDDEPPARERLLKLLGNFPDIFEVIGVAEDGVEGQEKIETLNPDLIFLDIEMPEVSGFDMLKRLKTIPIVIFCTAYDQYSLKAFETNSVDYLLKPVGLERLQQSVDKLKLFSDNKASQNIMQMLTDLSSKKEIKKMTSLTVKKGDKLIFLKLEEISHFNADERYVSVNSKEENYLIEDTLTQLEEKLPDNFLRVHRGVIINTDFIKEVQKYFNSRFVITLNNSKKSSITTGRSYHEAIKEWMGV
ncbi:LytR/AlgR family response regulator transcription factor [Wenyingzhuangia marina]|uniref:Two component transcriptional regulator, LytTR family n=1 Tax=Wenyingzhuangia marina TaxID=1195760 RepID=A0A1M5RYW0_9FLAO|nr:LytTR family DNA-binding domain-containing protein [Wenyingzhuangia marina]GGF78204.1 sensory transduction protein LytT [Wenyingzhuangia marina]SHH31228.1 two component transcriptional regulator, LytTR family [Wenyingzhuangia marina]